MDSQEAWSTEPSPERHVPPVFPQTTEADEKCRDCEESPVAFRCSRCPYPLCQDCWPRKRSHNEPDKGHIQLHLNGFPVEGPPRTFRHLEQAFESNQSEEYRDQQHRANYDTVWFAIIKAGQEPLSFESYPRFQNLISKHRQSHPAVKDVYPSLVSFVGNSGVGKSTLIQAIVRQLWVSTAEGNNDTSDQVPAPVIGDDSAIPTSSDVRLYGDPIGSRDAPQNPIFFADCEGFGGANRSAAANVFARDMEANHQPGASTASWTSPFMRDTWNSIRRNLKWSVDVKGRRDTALEHLFPRLLCNVSDVLVYVISETEKRQLGGVLQRLADWSQKSATAAINRTSLPSLIVVLNRSDLTTPDWTPDKTTNQLFDEHRETIDSVVGHSFSSVKFIRIPHRRGLARLASQTELLSEMIKDAAATAREAKQASNTLLEAEHQSDFCRMAFEHFSQHRDRPFDYIETVFSLNPLPTILAESLSSMLFAATNSLKAEERPLNSEALAKILLELVTPVICAAIAIDIHRTYKNVPVTFSKVVQGETSNPAETDMEAREVSYERQIVDAVNKFLDRVCDCKYYSKDGKSCVTKAAAHGQNGLHQDTKGNVIGCGIYDANDFHLQFSSSWYRGFLEGIDDHDEKRKTLLSEGKADMVLPMLREIHNNSILRMHETVNDMNYPDLLGCFWCLKHVPTERLSCGHWICEPCLLEISERDSCDNRLYIVRHCHRHSRIRELDPALEYLRLPSTLGRRLLSLDEGGVRSIVQLAILNEIQQELGRELPLQHCFDLVGGTGSGGIVALGLVSANWCVSEAEEKIRELMANTFSEKNDPSFFSLKNQPTCRSESLAKNIRTAFGSIGNLQLASIVSIAPVLQSYHAQFY
ncbi:uncharacterized protein LY79DRAFT_364130 [Colletotrichum navitas]|uniref:PNPLA domain-containing protein n=1 Tax=Colletotrichum navitas TaxID=681940 RepID=A0AAD8PQW1_9PEZI|nr:uncharacterized protein LY79DRAFT_364130 [Colletotrichum navitas]KAK1574621.1 hypothetical protein LY79DRAFT_364130 [Colletotrichum navitas]